MSESLLRAVVVEDERLQRTELVSLLKADGRIQVVAEAESIESAIIAIRQFVPHVVFLDIQLGGDSGFALLDHCADQEIVFVTAHDNHAVRAFAVNALDYLLKPVSPDRLRESIDRLLADQAEARRQPREEPLSDRDRLFLRLDDRWGFLRVGDIAVIQAEGNHSRVRMLNGEIVLVHKGLREWQERLPPRQFVRVHRSTIVNVEQVSRVDEWSHYAYQVHVRGLNEPLVMSRRYAARLKEWLG